MINLHWWVSRFEYSYNVSRVVSNNRQAPCVHVNILVQSKMYGHLNWYVGLSVQLHNLYVSDVPIASVALRLGRVLFVLPYNDQRWPCVNVLLASVASLELLGHLNSTNAYERYEYIRTYCTHSYIGHRVKEFTASPHAVTVT